VDPGRRPGYQGRPEAAMHNVHQNILTCVGDTPIVRMNRITEGLKANLYSKLEYLNPGASIKDRIALQIIEDAEKAGLLKPGGTIVEATSGNTGAGLAMAAAVKGYKCIFVLPDKQSEEKRAALRAFGAKVVITPTDVTPDDPRSYYKVSRRIADETPNAFYANQYHNPSNPLAHYLSTGPELWQQMDGKVDVLVAGLGTGGTISGVGRFLKEQNSAVRVVGVDPVGSLYYDYFQTGQMTEPFSYRIEGIGEDFLPSTMDFTYVDEVVRVADKEAFQMTRRLAREEGVLGGVSCGAAMAGALKYVRLHDRAGLNVVVLVPDSGSRYLSKVYNDKWMEENGFLEPSVGLGTVRDIVDGLGPREVIAVPDTMRPAEAIGLMKLHGISQVPVLRAGEVVGVLHETALLEAALKSGHRGQSVAELAEMNYCTVDATTEITLLTDLLRKTKIALILEDGKLKGVITRIDVLDHVAKLTSRG
jgi:cystathionine beta-synthase